MPAWAIHAEGNLGVEDAEAIVVDLPELRVPEEALRAGAEGTEGMSESTRSAGG